jgi:hypothetical protein
MRLMSALDKVLLDVEPIERPEDREITGFRNEVLSFQVAYAIAEGPPRDHVTLRIESPIAPLVRVRMVKHVPVPFPAMHDADENLISRRPGLFPDRLEALGEHRLRAYHGLWHSLWIDVEPGAAPGRYSIDVTLSTEAGEALASRTQWVEVLPAELPEQKLIHTKWFHADCLATHYGVDVFSEDHWRIMENFMRAAARRGINMILTPIHTPPLDTRVGCERPTAQLVDVYVDGGAYGFGFKNLDRWVATAKRAGMKYFEMAHLFTQWGANFAPKIVARVDGEVRRIFGWDTPASGEAYHAFLAAYLPAVADRLRALGVADSTYFHISDEPGFEHMDSYLAAKAGAAPYLQGFPIIDALSDFAFYQRGAVQKPIPANDHIEPFLEAGVPGLWTYYCVGQYKSVSNMFMAMPSARNRILGAQLYKFGIEGFLHWGYNFYYAQYADYPVDPYCVTDADGFAPSGDAFQVYPRADGQPEESIRMMVTAQAIYDMRALEMLEALAGREAALAVLEHGLCEPIRFDRYPASARWLLDMRRRVNREITARL